VERQEITTPVKVRSGFSSGVVEQKETGRSRFQMGIKDVAIVHHRNVKSGSGILRLR
jgi:hypothetical protein